MKETELLGNVGSEHKYSDIWAPDWREDIDYLATEMTHICLHCGDRRTGPARETALWFREHSARHGVKRKPLSKKADEKLHMKPTTPHLNKEGVPSHLVGNRNNNLLTLQRKPARVVENKPERWTHQSLMQYRDAFFELNGRMPTSKDEGFTGRAMFRQVKRIFGSWTNYKEYQG